MLTIARLWFWTVCCLWTGFALADSDPTKHAPELKLKSVSFAQSEEEISGFTMSDRQLLLVSDNDGDHYIYKAVPHGNRFAIGSHLLAYIDWIAYYHAIGHDRVSSKLFGEELSDSDQKNLQAFVRKIKAYRTISLLNISVSYGW